jgi:hypothetical protein
MEPSEAEEGVICRHTQQRPKGEVAQATASFARMRFGSLKETAQLRTWSTREERPLGRLQHL